MSDALLTVQSGSSVYGIETRLCRLEKLGLVAYRKPTWHLTERGAEVTASMSAGKGE